MVDNSSNLHCRYQIVRGANPVSRPMLPCPICGRLLWLDNYHTYYCQNLSISFCDDCISGVGGVDIICKVIEATPEVRSRIEEDCRLILKKRKERNRGIAKAWGAGFLVVATVIGICCLIWDPLDVILTAVTIVGLILVFAFYNWAKEIVLW